jgi:hypothetical protein
VATDTHAVAHALHEDTNTCFYCHASHDFKHLTLSARVASTAVVTPDSVLSRSTSQSTHPVPRSFFARAPPHISS